MARNLAIEQPVLVTIKSLFIWVFRKIKRTKGVKKEVGVRFMRSLYKKYDR